MKKLFLWGLPLLMAVFACTSCSNQSKKEASGEISGDLIIFHAGSLSVPFKQIVDSFKTIHPNVRILREAAGSVTCARKITELNKDCDVIASADYEIINKLLIPEHAGWNIKFASNEMVIAFDEDSKYHGQINKNNWYEILLKEEVTYGRSDPNSDPCGYRSVLLTELSSAFYNDPGIRSKLLSKDNEYIRPKETDLLALLQTGTIDYMFIYRSVAEQHGLKYIILPDSINLKKPGLADFYATAEVKIHGEKPGSFIIQQGEPMVYAITVCKNAPNKQAAYEFVKYLLKKNKGMKIMEQNGQPSVVPSYTKTYDQLPEELKEFANKNQTSL
ncbi:MAG: tungstate ABC transporter substrate-binding protein WtpA [Bacteroidales bacterium]|nr:tungstate ABC transporter substrate-binding protein WtpA [Bacteroidales bacterium]MCF8345252.1 tungstate ABC transporter substrate-binding protein WtpA [Bacteroidales bacterium]MCF8352252.1 tungstate ABC transporter substrate-binding protein WtpA [Bacteroidales bacterium]MCF8376104.1 tungstate ABC transporter substrate-binding protein WtpA [Bacteroidales bacterium]MCF8401417.1 tungstate ABC transporter substrate-binding protein WtpA [Bacteroidales bacterium]